MYFNDPAEEDPIKIKQRQDALKEIDKLAAEKGIILLSGVLEWIRGLTLFLAKKALEEFDEVHEFYSYGAGFPEISAATNPIKYKFTWSIIGVMLSYLRPAVVIKDGKAVEVPAREMFAENNMHILNIEELGSPLESFPNGNAAHYAELMGVKDTIKNMGRYICRWLGSWSLLGKDG